MKVRSIARCQVFLLLGKEPLCLRGELCFGIKDELQSIGNGTQTGCHDGTRRSAQHQSIQPSNEVTDQLNVPGRKRLFLDRFGSVKEETDCWKGRDG